MNDLKALCEEFQPCGSRVTCNPSPMDTDEDFILLVPEVLYDAFHALAELKGFDLGGSLPIHVHGPLREEDAESFYSYTRGVTNLICTASPVFYRRFMAATSVAKRLNLMNKTDRVALFQAVLYGTPCDPRMINPPAAPVPNFIVSPPPPN